MVTIEKWEAVKRKVDEGMFDYDVLLKQYSEWEQKSNLQQYVDYYFGKKYPGIDLDVSLVAMYFYKKMFPEISLDQIELQGKPELKYEIRGTGDLRYKGDTLTSSWTVFRLYLFYLKRAGKLDWNFIIYRNNLAIDESVQDYQKEDKNFKEYFGRKISDESEFYNTIQNCIKGSSLEEYIKSYMIAGNYMLIPGNSHKKWSFNNARSQGGKKDTVDYLLWIFYQYFYFKEYKDEVQAKNSIFSLFKKNCVEEKTGKSINELLYEDVLQWLSDFGMQTWESFIKRNYLSAFVGSNLRPISLKTGKEIDLEVGKSYDPMPSNLEECECFFKQASDSIKMRTKELLKLNKSVEV